MADARGSGPRERKLMGVQIPPSAPTSDLRVAEISEFATAKLAADRVAVCQADIRLLNDKGTVAAQRAGSLWLVNVPSLRHYMANHPKPGLKLNQKTTGARKIATT
jgi:hypothetical protein